MHSRLAEAMGYLDDQRRELLDTLEGVPVEKLMKRPAPESWSVAQIVEHLRVVEGGVARLLAKRAIQAREAGMGEETSTDSVLNCLDEHMPKLLGPIKSPSAVQPRADVNAHDALAGLHISRQALRTAAETADGLPLGKIKHTHPVLGDIDLYQWLIFIGQHEARHARQIRRTLESFS
jgi:hypothetical protein